MLHPSINPLSKPLGGEAGLALWLRMLFSCLVDADFLDTEQFIRAENTQSRGRYLPYLPLLDMLDTHLAELTSLAKPTLVNRVRAKVLQECRERATDYTFSFTVPTGGGKTLSSMAFALKHAVQHGNQRIIYVIPYTSILEQTVGIFRDIFGPNVAEPHSNLDPEEETAKSRLATENWDAPVIVTTNVQSFESFFASQPSRCRKVHNIVNSVVVLDEAQLFNLEFLQPIPCATGGSVHYYTIVIAIVP